MQGPAGSGLRAVAWRWSSSRVLCPRPPGLRRHWHTSFQAVWQVVRQLTEAGEGELHILADSSRWVGSKSTGPHDVSVIPFLCCDSLFSEDRWALLPGAALSWIKSRKKLVVPGALGIGDSSVLQNGAELSTELRLKMTLTFPTQKSWVVFFFLPVSSFHPV